MRTGIITQARTTSTRLPGKVLIEVAGRTLLDHHLDRLATSGIEVLVATTVNATDDPIAELAHARGLTVHRGSELDVLSRFHECARDNGLDVVVRVTSDCPLIDGALIAAAVEDWVRSDDTDLYLSNGLQRTFPRGFDFEVFSAAALAEAHREARLPAEREHVTPYLYTNVNGRTVLRNVALPVDKSAYRVTLDTADDLAALRTLMEDHHAHELDCAAIIELLDAHPEIVALNSHVEQKKLDDSPSPTEER